MKQVVTGGTLSVRVKNSAAKYFGTHKGVRQAGPISPLIFNYAWDVLVGMFRKEHDGGLICGLVPH
jgi:hypothetical protein